ncbi:uncharacterized protein LOC121833113 [Ixodes scapularis]|uniref:uncharacterized protein LOC121833113 n=1 Tax=Ixodes scapularis TaxID=6945 RepID=UPI001C3883A3|nr:uncharacterized protein LOC121833113 [Ixodes scapularis]
MQAPYEKIVNDGRHMSRAECRTSYHLGNLCSGVAESTFDAMGVGKREVWRCRVCRQRHSGNESRSEASSSQCASPAGTEHLRSLEAKLECLTLLKANVDTLLDLPTQMNQLLTLKPVVESLKSAVTEVQKDVDFLSARYDSLLFTATTNSTATTELRKETTLLRSVVTEQSQTIEHLKEELNDTSCLSNLEIHGLPHAPSENLVSVVGELAGKQGLENFQPRDILAVHRLPSRRDGPPVILVKLASVSLREQWLATRGKLRTLAAEGSLPKLFLNENLTRKNRELFWMVREKARFKQYQFTRVKNKKPFAKKLGTSSLVRIHRLADLELIV